VLLASAGRDRLVHIFDCSGGGNSCKPLLSLDHHSSSVTAVRFTADGRRLVSASGDKTMVLAKVNGRHVARGRTIATPLGSVNGLAIDATNKFAVSSGQDKKVLILVCFAHLHDHLTSQPHLLPPCSLLQLSIWNLASGRNIRAYNPAPDGTPGSELYKCDIDPSGTFVAVCGFDKAIRLLDFFSGEVVASVTGHGELITGLRFSPDGRRLISVAGDGGVFVWALAPALIEVMQQRMVELFASAARREERAKASSPPTTAAAAAAIKIASALPPPPPTVATTSGEATLPPPPPEPRRSKWAAKAAGLPKGVQVAGQHLQTDHERKNKFTLELSETCFTAEDASATTTATSIGAAATAAATATTPAEESQAPPIAASPRSINVLARTLEDTDDVNLELSDSDDADDDDSTEGPDFAPPAASVASPVRSSGRPTVAAVDPLVESLRKINELERRAGGIEDWLETQLREERELAQHEELDVDADTDDELEEATGQPQVLQSPEEKLNSVLEAPPPSSQSPLATAAAPAPALAAEDEGEREGGREEGKEGGGDEASPEPCPSQRPRTGRAKWTATPLSSSLTSDFFRNLKRSRDGKLSNADGESTVDPSAAPAEDDSAPPPPPPPQQQQSLEGPQPQLQPQQQRRVANAARATKRQQTASALEAMRERLKVPLLAFYFPHYHLSQYRA
jgi:hypothetical protein